MSVGSSGYASRDHASDAYAPDEYAGVVLAGGRSTRFGSDKCGHPFRGRSLIEHALDAFPAGCERWIVGGPRREFPAVRWLPDEPPGRGPLAGVAAAFGATGTPWIAVVACDMPSVPPRLWAMLLARADDARIVVPEGPNGLQPTAALYHRDLGPVVEASLADGQGSPRPILADHGLVVPWRDLVEDLPADAFRNVNRPEDLP